MKTKIHYAAKDAIKTACGLQAIGWHGYPHSNQQNKIACRSCKRILKALKDRLAYLRKEIQAERISYGEIAELQTLIPHIDPKDVLLLEWAGVKERI